MKMVMRGIRRRTPLAWIVGLALTGLLPLPQAAAQNFIQITTGTTGGTFYPAGIALANLIADNLDVRASAISSAGSVENVDLLRNGEANMAFIQIDVAQDAIAGRKTFEGNGYPDMVLLTPLFRSVDHLVVTTNSGIDSLEDFKGHRIAVGRAGSGTLLTSEALLQSAGMTLDDIQPDYIGQGEALDALKNGMIDGAPISGGTPVGALTEALTVAGDRLKILQMTPEQQESFVETTGWKVPDTIPAGVYPGQDEPIRTTAHLAMLMVPKDFSNDLAAQILDLIYDHIDELRGAHAVYNSVSREGSSQVAKRVDLPMIEAAQEFFSD